MTQTFMISSDYSETARCLDNRRLNKQITEAFQVYRYLTGEGKMQGNPHPYNMWRGYEVSLLRYIVNLHVQWQLRLETGKRGGKLNHKNGLEAEQEYVHRIYLHSPFLTTERQPAWVGNEEVLSSHRSALLYKDVAWYSQFGWKEQPAIPSKINKNGSVTLPYVWTA